MHVPSNAGGGCRFARRPCPLPVANPACAFCIAHVPSIEYLNETELRAAATASSTTSPAAAAEEEEDASSPRHRARQFMACPGCKSPIRAEIFDMHQSLRCQALRKARDRMDLPCFRPGIHLRGTTTSQQPGALVADYARLTSPAGSVRERCHLQGRSATTAAELERVAVAAGAYSPLLVAWIADFSKQHACFFENGNYSSVAGDLQRLRCDLSFEQLAAVAAVGKHRIRHVLQEFLISLKIQSVLRSALPAGAVPMDRCLFVEPGAGKGGLTHCLALHFGARHLIQVDLGLFRDRRDWKLEQTCETFQRLQMDICDFDLGACVFSLPQPRSQSATVSGRSVADLPRVVVGKHVCGVALDFSLRMAVDGDADAVFLATCCHGKCVYDQFSAADRGPDAGGLHSRDAFQELSKITVRGIDAFRKVEESFRLSWETAASLDFLIPVGHVRRETDDREEIQLGRNARYSLDLMRCLFLLHSGGFDHVRLWHYAADALTPENVLLLALKSRSPRLLQAAGAGA